MQKKATLEIIICFALMLLGLAAYFTIGMAEETASTFLLRQERGMGALDYKSLPQIYALALILLCAANIALNIVKQRKSAPGEHDPASPSAGITIADKKMLAVRTMATAALLIAYTVIMPFVPFFASTAVFLLLLFMLYGKTDMKIVLPLTAAGTAFFWFVFIKIASLPIGSM